MQKLHLPVDRISFTNNGYIAFILHLLFTHSTWFIHVLLLTSYRLFNDLGATMQCGGLLASPVSVGHWYQMPVAMFTSDGTLGFPLLVVPYITHTVVLWSTLHFCCLTVVVSVVICSLLLMLHCAVVHCSPWIISWCLFLLMLLSLLVVFLFILH